MLRSNNLSAYFCTVKNYYKVLNLKQTASLFQIKQAYKNLANKYHPDHKQGRQSSSTELALKQQLHQEIDFRDIFQAYEILSKEDKRIAYDSLLNSSIAKQQSSYNELDLQTQRLLKMKTKKYKQYYMMSFEEKIKFKQMEEINIQRIIEQIKQKKKNEPLKVLTQQELLQKQEQQIWKISKNQIKYQLAQNYQILKANMVDYEEDQKFKSDCNKKCDHFMQQINQKKCEIRGSLANKIISVLFIVDKVKQKIQKKIKKKNPYYE